MMSDLDYPVANPPDVAPVIYRAMIIQAMALEYFKLMRGSEEPFDLDDALAAAHATWATDWSNEGPRTIEMGIDEAQGDFEHWGDDQ